MGIMENEKTHYLRTLKIIQAESKLSHKLEQDTILSNLTNCEVERIAEKMTFKQYKKGNSIFLYKDTDAKLHFLAKGQVKSTRYSKDGKEIVLHMVNSGEFFALIPAFLNIPYTGTAVALEDCLVGLVSRQSLLELVGNYPEIGLKIMGALALRTKKLLQRIEREAAFSPMERVISFLIDEVTSRKTYDFILPYRKSELAGSLGIVPETLSRCLSHLQKENLLRVENQTIHIENINGLKHRLEPGWKG